MSNRSAARGTAAASSMRLTLRTSNAVATSNASPSRCFLFCNGSRAARSARTAAATVSTPPIPKAPPNQRWSPPITSSFQGARILMGGEGAKVTRVEIKDIIPPADLAGAMARQMKAEREKRAAVLEAEGLRQAEILRAEGRKQSAILEAEGRREAAFRDAEARERGAEAEARATTLVSEAIGKGDLAAANFLVAEKYIEAMRAIATAPNQRVVVVPIEAAALAGTLGG